ncbi:cbb3-type cytochrome c oxidase subunit I, partial [Hydrogenovibrio sp. 3SP14C1]|uniref:cbb3-type cytochrome c oxidase subunit I n=1 Tax=Hydrogenovibrio sp. 3SP14C1 TaxID=3038774 RepID=UPI00301421CC
MVAVRIGKEAMMRTLAHSDVQVKLGIMYFVVALVMLLRGFADAIMMRTQLAMAAGGAAGYLPPEHYDQIFTAHGVIMIFFVAMPMVIGLM